MYSEPCQTSKMELFAEVIDGFKSLTILTKISIFNVWLGSDCAFSKDHEE